MITGDAPRRELDRAGGEGSLAEDTLRGEGLCCPIHRATSGPMRLPWPAFVWTVEGGIGRPLRARYACCMTAAEVKP